MQTKEKTRVIFRQFETGEIIALFPSEVGTLDVSTCMSYMHFGQHGSADLYGIIGSTVQPISWTPVKQLISELTGLGYNLVICKRTSRKDFETRVNKLKRGGK